MSALRRLSLPPEAARVEILVDGRAVTAAAGDSVATVLLAQGRLAFARNAKTGAPSPAYCLIGLCFGCLCRIDGRPGVQACLEPVRAGMVVETALGQGAP